MVGRLLYAAATVASLHAASATAATGKNDGARQLREIVFQNYPPRALAAGEQGAVFFVVRLDKDAHATDCEVTHGSGHPLLDIETCQLIVLHAEFKSAKDANGRLTQQTAEGVVNWTIPGREPEPIRPIMLTGDQKPEKQICKKSVRVGTVAGVERTCMTSSEWAKRSDEFRQTFEELQGRRGFTSEGMCQGPTCDSIAQQEYLKALATQNPR